MEKKNGEFQKYSMDDAMRLAQTDAAKQLIALLQQQNGVQLQRAIAQASTGDFESAKSTLSQLLSNPQAAALLQQLKE